MKLKYSRTGRFRGMVESLEARICLSASFPGQVVTATSSALAGASLHSASADLSVTLQHQVDTLSAHSHDYLRIEFRHHPAGGFTDTFTYEQSFDGSTPFLLSSASDSVRLGGTFSVGNSSESRNLTLDLRWVRTDSQLQIDSEQLDTQGNARQYTRSTLTFGHTSLTGSARWTTSADTIFNLAASPAGLMEASASQTQSLPAKFNVESLLQSLSPPAQMPRGAQLFTEAQCGASVALRDSGGNDAGAVILSSGGQYLPKPQLLNTSGLLVASYPQAPGTNTLFSSITNGIAIASDASSATLAVTTADTPAASANLHWQPAAAAPHLSFTRQVSTAPGVTLTEYWQTLEREAAVTGTLNVAAPGYTQPAFMDGQLTMFRHLSIRTGATAAAAATTTASVPTVADWQSLVHHTWRETIQLTHAKPLPTATAPTAAVATWHYTGAFSPAALLELLS